MNVVENMGNKRMHSESQKKYNMRNRRMRVCSSLPKLRNEIMRIYLLLAIRLQKALSGNYAGRSRTNKIN